VVTVLSEDVVDPGMGRLKCMICVGVVELLMKEIFFDNFA
jgi:hypothetical protein